MDWEEKHWGKVLENMAKQFGGIRDWEEGAIAKDMESKKHEKDCEDNQKEKDSLVKDLERLWEDC